MKKIFLFAATLMLAAAASAQSVTHERTFSGLTTSIVPKMFSYDNETLLVNVTEEGIAEVYNSNLEKVRSFAVNTAIASELNDLVFHDYWSDSHPNESFDFSQTLFNDDEKFEYVIGSTVFNEDGEVVLTLPENQWEYKIMVLGSDMDSYPKVYLITYYTKYQPYESYKSYYRIDKTVSKVEYVRTMAAPGREVYDTEGRRLPAPQRGVNIIRESDGSTGKYLVK